MLRKSLEEARARAGETQVTCAQRVKEAETILEALKADAESTTGSQEAARQFLSEKISALEAAQATVVSEEAICEEAKVAKAAVDQERQQLEAAKAEVESVQNGSFRMLLDGGWEDEEVRDDCIEGVCSYLTNADTDAVLMAALPKALKHRPAECGVFDKIALEEADRLFSEKVAAYTAKLAEGEEKFEDISAEYSGACAILDLAGEKVEAASQGRDEADSALSNITVDKKLAQSKVMDQDKALAALLAESTMAEAMTQQLEGALNALSQLEAGENVDKENQENKENVMAVDQESTGKAMEVDQPALPLTTA